MSKRLGIIGGSGLYEIPGVDVFETHSLDTPWGAPSAPILECKYKAVSYTHLRAHETQ